MLAGPERVRVDQDCRRVEARARALAHQPRGDERAVEPQRGQVCRGQRRQVSLSFPARARSRSFAETVADQPGRLPSATLMKKTTGGCRSTSKSPCARRCCRSTGTPTMSSLPRVRPRARRMCFRRTSRASTRRNDGSFNRTTTLHAEQNGAARAGKLTTQARAYHLGRAPAFRHDLRRVLGAERRLGARRRVLALGRQHGLCQ